MPTKQATQMLQMVSFASLLCLVYNRIQYKCFIIFVLFRWGFASNLTFSRRSRTRCWLALLSSPKARKILARVTCLIGLPHTPALFITSLMWTVGHKTAAHTLTSFATSTRRFVRNRKRYGLKNSRVYFGVVFVCLLLCSLFAGFC